MSPMAEAVYRKMIDLPEPDFEAMLVLADALEEDGDDKLSHAYRWAAENRKFPWLRQSRGSRDPGNVYDWDRADRVMGITLPQHCLLPVKLYSAIRDMKDKKYGSIDDAFFLLARALETLPTLEQ